ncbi:MAG: choice-of-anchor J domain-containing protein, partial [Candidatus Delongbacteria bacterium]|nr:choice-of-anchor J domain-containing protein [Candidatus Delongbacteria bacterium]
MRKTVLIILAILITNLLAVDKYSSREIIPTINRSIAAKDTSWHSYYSEMYYLWQEKEERVTLIKADDFGLEYPVNLHGVSSYLFEAGYNFTYKIYDTDGITLLWNSAELISVTDFNDLLLDTLMIMTDDFYLSILPDAIGMPRQASSNITGSNHSYYGSPSEWLPFYDADERYEWVTQVSLTQFEGLDTHPPIVRSLTGNKNFMDVDANLNLIVQDASNVISPINAEYTLDGGSTWNSFTMNSLKGNYSFSGIVSGQPDGAVGSVKFFLEDSLSNSQWSEEYPLFWSKENLLIDEGFEGDIFPPNGWSMQIIDSTGTGFDKYQTGGYSGDVYSGNYCAEHFYGELENFSDDWLITPLVDIPTGKPTFFSFWQKGYDVDYIVNSIHEVGISTDKVAWDIVYSGFPPGGETGIGDVWEYINLSLAAYSGQKVYIGFHYNANYEDVWMIDDVQAFIDFEGPAISSISANPALLPNIGAFANNDMDIKLNVSDKSGVASITGHYTFDGGSTYTNLDFLPFKFENEVWKGIIPALPTETIGLINFTMIDSIGNTIDSDQYDIHFVDDNEVVSVENFEHQRPVFVNDSIDISVTFNDESTIDSCKAYYSNDNWTTQDEIIMTASKYHSYTYTGIIPAEMTETFGKVKFGITDSSDNTLVTDEYEVEWLEGSLIYFDDFDGNHIFADWDYSDGGWGYNTTSYYSPVKSVSDSPNGNY